MKRITTRRTVLRASGLAAASLALSGCAPHRQRLCGQRFFRLAAADLGEERQRRLF